MIETTNLMTDRYTYEKGDRTLVGTKAAERIPETCY